MIKYFSLFNIIKKEGEVTYLQQKLYSCSPIAAVAPHRWSLLQSQTHLINFPHSRICFRIIISIANRSFFQSFLSLYLTFFSLHPLMLSSFIQPQLSFLQVDITENPYSSITHMLFYMHVHFLIITYIHISCIFSMLVSQCASVRITQFFYIFIYSIHVKVYYYCLTWNCYCSISNCYCLTLNCYCPISNCYCLTFKELKGYIKLFFICPMFDVLTLPSNLNQK